MTANTNLVLHQRANGVVKDGKFYPFGTWNPQDTTKTLTCRKGTRFFVKSVQLTAASSGIKAASYNRVYCIKNSENNLLGYINLPAMTQASDFVSDTVFCQAGVLADLETPLYYSTNATSSCAVVVYAEVDDV